MSDEQHRHGFAPEPPAAGDPLRDPLTAPLDDLMGDPLTPLPGAIEQARRTVRNIRQNIIVFAFGLNAVAVILAGLRVLGPVAAAIVHQIGSLLVIMNAIRLLGFEGWRQFGIVRAGVRPILGADRVSRMVLGLVERYWEPGSVIDLVDVNGDPGMALFGPDGAPVGVIGFGVVDGLITETYVVVNPEKLKHVKRSAAE